MKPASPLLGFNNNVRHKGRVFHIQTEDSGVRHPHIITHLFADGGRILKTAKTSYAEFIGTANMAEVVRGMMQEQHKAMFMALRDGQFDTLVDDGQGRGTQGSLAAVRAAVAPVASAPVPAVAPPIAAAPLPVAATAPPLARTATAATTPAMPAAIRKSAPPGEYPAAAPLAAAPPAATALPAAASPPRASVPPPLPLPLPPLAKVPPPPFAQVPAAPSTTSATTQLPRVPPPPLPYIPTAPRPAALQAPTAVRTSPLARPRLDIDPGAIHRTPTRHPTPPGGTVASIFQTTEEEAPAINIETLERAAAEAETPFFQQIHDLPPPPQAVLGTRSTTGTTGSYSSVTSPVSTATGPQSARGRYAPSRPSSIFATVRPQEGASIFGEDLISEKSLDEVILSYLAEDLEAPAEKK